VSTPPDPFSQEARRDPANNVEEPAIAPPGTPEETAAPEQIPSPEATLPPEAQGETNGGPLGCCLGIVVGLLLSLSIAVFSRLYADPLASVLSGNLSLTVRFGPGMFGTRSRCLQPSCAPLNTTFAPVFRTAPFFHMTSGEGWSLAH